MNLKPTKPLSGFVELTPAQQRCFDECTGKMINSLKLAGFQRLDLPVIERFEVLTDKENFDDIDTEMYVFEKGDTKMGLRYDGTIGLARYVAGHLNDLTFPFRAYQLAKNYRAERPQKGRYREFYQIDLDILGQGDLSINYDVEIIAAMGRAFDSIKAEVGEVYARIGSRAFWNAAFDVLGIAEFDKTRAALVLIDKREKMEESEFKKALADLVGENAAGDIIATFADPRHLSGRSAAVDSALTDLEFVVKQSKTMGVDAQLDLSIMRGHGYYTGTVFEFYFKDNVIKTQIGGGGRYENLVSKFSKTKIVGVGAGFGPSRIFVPMLEDNKIDLSKYEPQAEVVAMPIGREQVAAVFEAVRVLRDANIVTSTFLDPEKKFKNIIEYADKTKALFAIIIGEDEVKAKTVTLKNMTTGEQGTLSLQDAIQAIKRVLPDTCHI
ncbi:MAG: histidine--tRNA ligase [Alphaproteobacteria bacterium]|nr:histidine--tRNA ligase [Alphaproteobacteria bacterium]